MKHINSASDFRGMLEADRAVVFISFPWSDRSTLAEKSFTEWRRQANSRELQLYQLTPDHHPFAWQWLDTVFGETPDEQRTHGAVVWLRAGSAAGVAHDAGAVGVKTLARVTKDCFTLGKTYTAEAIATLQNERAPLDPEFLKILCCPETYQALALADASVLDKINQRQVAGSLQNRAGQPVQDKIEDGLVRADGRYLYPMRRNIPVLLVDEAIPLR